MPKLPDCPNGCDTAGSLEPLSADCDGAIWCVCSCCAKKCLVKAGLVVYPAPSSDVSGVAMTDP